MRLRTPRPTAVDFETFGIQPRPLYPPVPVGVAIKPPGRRARYYAWGHASGNNCTWAEARAALEAAWANPDGVVCQHGKFDLDVAEVHMGLSPPAWDHTHDSMFLLFLDDPHQLELGLKPSAERLLGREPVEQDALVGWLVERQPVPAVRISRSAASLTYAMRFVPFAPGDVVGPYACSDVDCTSELFELLWPRIQARGMGGAYDRERRLAPVLLGMERTGVPVDLPKLRSHVARYRRVLARLDAWVIKRLRASPDLNLASGPQLVNAMLHAGVADVDALGTTPTGRPRTDKEALLAAVTDKRLLGVLKYRTQLGTCLATFMEPWLEQATATGGLIHTTWHQVKGDVGARTGRLSSTPNLQNAPKTFEPIFRGSGGARKLPVAPWPELPPLPLVRSYVIPFPGEVLVDRDYSQQEPRILAHFDGGELMARYNTEPWVDFHDFARAELERVGLIYERRPVKNTNLGLIYGMGNGKLAAKNDMSVEEAADLRKAILRLYPGLKAMYADMRRRAALKEPVRTWGGREYHCEPPRLVEGRIRQFDYKLVNVLIQGSAADCTKEAILRFDAARRPGWRLLLNVHDQLTVSAPKREVDQAMACLRTAMESVEFDVPMLSEGATSATHWAALRDYDKKGRRVPVRNR